MNSAMPPAPGSMTAARTSSTDSAVSRSPTSRITPTVPRYPPELPRHAPVRNRWESRSGGGWGAAAAAAGPAHYRRRPDDGDGRAGGRDRGLLAGDAPPGDGMVAGPLLEQRLEGRGVVIGGPPACRAQGRAVHDPGVDHIAQVRRRRGGDPHPVQALSGPERQPGGPLDSAQPTQLPDLLLFDPAIA